MDHLYSTPPTQLRGNAWMSLVRAAGGAVRATRLSAGRISALSLVARSKRRVTALECFHLHGSVTAWGVKSGERLDQAAALEGVVWSCGAQVRRCAGTAEVLASC